MSELQEILLKKSADKNNTIRELVATCSRTEKNILLKLAQDKIEEVRLEAVKNKNFPYSELSKIKLKGSEVKEYLAANNNTPLDVLKSLSCDKDENVASIALANDVLTSTKSPTVLKKLSKSKFYVDRRNAARNKNITPDIAKDLIEDEDEGVLVALAENSSTPTKILATLSEHESDDVKAGVAKNTNTADSILLNLCKSENDYIRWGVSQNIKCSLEAQQYLSKNKEFFIRRSLAQNPSVTPEILKLLLKNKEYEVRAAVAENVNSTSEILTLLLKDKEENVRAAITINPNITLDIIRKLIKDKSDWVITHVLLSKFTPAELLEEHIEKSPAYIIRNPSANESQLIKAFNYLNNQLK